MSSRIEDPSAKVPLPGLLEAAKAAMYEDFGAELGKAGYGEIRPTHGCVFRFVHGDGIRLTELAQLAGMTKQSVGEVVDSLEALGYTERFPDPEDRRAKLIRLTEKGKQAQRTGRKLFDRVERRWAKRFGAERIATMRELLEEIVPAEGQAEPSERRRAAAGT